MPRIYTIAFWFSVSLAVAAIVVTAMFGLRLGIDFRGGSVLEFAFQSRPATK